jgi:hypothetical protein
VTIPVPTCCNRSKRHPAPSKTTAPLWRVNDRAVRRQFHRRAEALADRPTCGARLLELAKPGDRILIMGARDDTLTTFAQDLLAALKPSA